MKNFHYTSLATLLLSIIVIGLFASCQDDNQTQSKAELIQEATIQKGIQDTQGVNTEYYYYKSTHFNVER
jgi:hypothetical protein